MKKDLRKKIKKILGRQKFWGEGHLVIVDELFTLFNKEKKEALKRVRLEKVKTLIPKETKLLKKLGMLERQIGFDIGLNLAVDKLDSNIKEECE